MSRTKAVVLMAGAALGLTGTAMAQNLDQSRAYQAELNADAAGRTSLLSSAQTSGRDERGFFLSDASGDNRLNIGGLGQFRYMINQRDEVPAGDEDTTIGFQNRRTQVIFSGNVINKDFTFRIQQEFSRSTGSAGLLDAYGKYRFENGASLAFGQFKAPLLREELVGDANQLTADRSVTNTVFTGGRTQGVALGFEGEQFRINGAFSDGANAQNSDFNSSLEADYALTARAEFLGGGDWKQFNQFSSWQGSEFGWMIGGAAHYQDGGETGGTVDVAVLRYTLDASIVGDGWNAFAAFIGANTDPAVGTSTDDFAVLVQGGLFVSSQWELFGRWETIIIDDSTRGANVEETFNILTVGTNYYFIEKSQAARFTADFLWFFEGQARTGGVVPVDTANGLLADTEGSQWNLRLQMQWLF